MESLSGRIARRFLASQVRILVDVPATLAIRKRVGGTPIVATFDETVSLYRVFDEAELSRVVSTGRITGGTYSAKIEREHGASWGADISNVITWGNGQRGKRLGDELFLAKLDGFDHRFFHIDPEIPGDIDPEGPREQPATISRSRIYTGVGASVMNVTLDDVELFTVDVSGHIKRISHAEAREIAQQRPSKPVDLREVHPDLYQGSILGVDVRVWRSKGTWGVYLNDERQIVSGAKSKDDAIELAQMSIRARPGKPVPMDGAILEQRRRHERLFETDQDPGKVRGSFAIKPKDRLQVLKGSSKLDIRAYTTLTVADVFQTKGEREVTVKVINGSKPIVLYATHPNRLAEETIALLDSGGGRILVQLKR